MGSMLAGLHTLSLLEPHIGRPFPFLLESALPHPRWGLRSFAGSDPYRVVLAKGVDLTIWEEGRERRLRGNPFDLLEELRREEAWVVGWFGYDLGRHLERLPFRAEDDLVFPDLYLGFYDHVDTPEGRVGSPRRRAAVDPVAYREVFIGTDRAPLPRNFSKERYLAAIGCAREYIAAGDIYQVNLSQRFETDGPTPYEVYLRLREASPAPYAAYLEVGDRALLSSSPELFLETDGRHVVTRPIKGTRPRRSDPAEDEEMRRELSMSPKDDAELAMIVDLERNDLGRVCEYGSVRVEAPKELESYPTVHHLVATVTGRLREEVGPVDLLRATFPSGSVTGAPKIRAMEIIDELEPTRRGVYTGAVGMIRPSGDMTLSVAIRVLHHDRGRWSFQAGGAIVADSDPEEEYRETLVKAAGMARALEMEWNTSR